MKRKVVVKLLAALTLVFLALTALTACLDTGYGCYHSYGAWYQHVAPTCDKPGELRRKCNLCGLIEMSETPALGHDLIHHDAKAATCAEPGHKAYDECSRCDYSTYEEITLKHDLKHYEGKPATCTDEGYKEYDECTLCDYTTYEKIDALGHKESAAVEENRVEATCESGGSYDLVVYCSTCKEKLSTEHKTITKLGHEYSNYVSNSDATCESDGTKTAYCNHGCGQTNTITDIDSALGHNYGEVSYVWADDYSTCTATRICVNDSSHIETEIVKSLVTVVRRKSCVLDELSTYSATFKNSAFAKQTKENVKTADKSGHKESAAVEENRVEATCESDGNYDLVVYCSTCGEKLSTEHKTITALGHDLKHHDGKEATCTDDGYKAYDTCSRCEYTTYEKIDALGHKESAAVEENRVEATCEKDGGYDLVVYCSTCAEKLSTEHKTIEKSSHDFSNNAEYCKNCNIAYFSEGLEYELVESDNGSYYKVIGKGAATGTRLVIPATYNDLPVTEISSYAFYGCSALVSVAIPDSITSISNYAFKACSSFTNITVPNSVTSIGSGAFAECTSLEEITIPFVGAKVGATENDRFHTFGYIFGEYSYEGSRKANQYYCDRSYISYYIPKNLTKVTVTGGNILYGAFYACSSLTSITVSNNIASMGAYAFYACSNLTNITIPESVTSIGAYAFSSCSSLASVIIPENVAAIGERTFYGCSSLTNITIPENVTTIGDYAFSGCSSLTNITIPENVTTIGDYAFSGCSALEKIYYGGTEGEWADITIGSSNTYLTNATRYYYSETQPTVEGNYWHYVNGEIVEW